MCNLSQGIKEQAYVEGTENGIAIGKQEGIAETVPCSEETRRSLSLHQHGRFRKRRERRFWIRQKDLPEESDIRMLERWNFW